MIIYKFNCIIRGILFRLYLNFRYKNTSVGRKFRIGKNCSIRIRKNSNIILGENVVLGDGVKLSVLNGGVLSIDSDVGIGDYSQIVCHSRIQIGQKSNIAPHTYMYDHDHLYSDGGVVRDKYRVGSIKIGERCWVGTNSVILRDTCIGDNTIIGAGSVIKGTIPSKRRVIQKRITELKEIH